MAEPDPNDTPVDPEATPEGDAPEQAPADTPEDAPEESPSDAGSMAEEALAAANEALSAFDPNAPFDDGGDDDDPMAALVDEAKAEAAGGGPSMDARDAAAFTPGAFDSMGTQRELPDGLDLLADVNLNVKIELGRTRMFVEDVLRLNSGSVVELDKLAGDPVDIYVNDRPVARGEVLVLNDNFCVRISEIISRIDDDDIKAAADDAAA